MYSFSMFEYEGVWIGLMQVMNYPRCISSNGGKECAINAYFSTSRDGVHFDLGWVYANITMGLEKAHPHAMRFSTSNQWVTRNGKHELLYSTSQVPHPPGHYGPLYWMKYEVDKDVETHEEVFHVAQWKEDRVVGLGVADAKEPGLVETKKFKVAGSTLILSVDTLKDGAVAEVEMDVFKGADVAQTISSAPISGTDSTVNVEFDGLDLDSLKGSTVQLRITLKGGAQLFALTVEE